jgi:uncharacterized RDD family membrane protein YckC
MQAEAQPAPALRRILAWLVDVTIATVLSLISIGLFGFFVSPPETAGVLGPQLFGGLALGFVYFAYATPFFGNSVGKVIFGLRIVGDRRHEPTYWEWTVRTLVNVIWPVNAIVMLASDGGRHLGDRAARTHVVLDRPERPFWLALVASVVVVVAGFELAAPAGKLGMINSSVCKTARAFLAEQRPGARVARFPELLQLLNDQALLDYRVGDEWDRVLLEREPGGSWHVTRTARIDKPGSGISIHFTESSSSDD